MLTDKPGARETERDDRVRSGRVAEADGGVPSVNQAIHAPFNKRLLLKVGICLAP